jgi:hypothetical protein
VVEGVLGPFDVPCSPVDERDVRPGRLEVEKALRLDLCEAFGLPGLREVAACKRRTLAAVVPAAESGDQNRLTQARPAGEF